MAKKFKKSTKSLLNILLVVLALSLFLFGVVIFKINNGNQDVKGESTTISNDSKMRASCNMTVNPPRRCPSGYECKSNPRNNPRLVGSDGVCMKQNLAKEGEACGRSMNQACRKDLICAPLGSSYRLLSTQATEVESTTESEGVTTEEKLCLGKTEDEIKTGCFPYIPYYGACVKKGVWPPPTQKPTPTQTPTPSSKECYKRPVQLPCVIGKPCPMPIPPPPGAILCTPTPTPSNLSPTPTSTPSGQVSCVWCGLNCVDTSTIQACAMIAPPQGYSCVNMDSKCVKVANGGSSVPKPVPSRQPLPNWWPFR